MRPAPVLRRLAALALLVSTACGGGREVAAEPSVGSAASAEEPLTVDVRPALQASFDALAAAVAAHEDELAQALLDRILRLGPDEAELEYARAFERVLTGRRLVRNMNLRLAAELDARGRVRVELRASVPLEPLVIRTGGAVLRARVTVVDAGGSEERRLSTVGLDDLDRLRLSPDRTRRVELGVFDLPVGGGLAARARFDLRLIGGAVETEAGSFPAMGFVVRPCEVVRLAAFLPSQSVDPGELLSYVRGPRVSTPALLERSVRIAPSRRREALDRLTLVALELDRIRLGEIVPALRWLADTTVPGGDPDLWREWLADRARSLEAGAAPTLDLPDPVRPASQAVPESRLGIREGAPTR